MIKKYDETNCLEELKKYCNTHEKCIVREIEKSNRLLYKALMKYYGGLYNALKKINMLEKSYRLLPVLKTREEWGKYIVDIYKRYGKVTLTIIKNEKKYSYKNFSKVVGSIESILCEYNIPLSQGQRKFIGKEELDREIKRIEEKFGYCSKPLMEKDSYINPKVVNRIYGNFSNMYEELDVKRHPSGIVPTDDELIADAKRVYNEFGIISKQILSAESKYSDTCFHDRLGGINGVCKILNIEPQKAGSQKTAFYVFKKYEKYLNETPVFEKTFDWLYNPDTNKKLRIDAYFPKHNIAIEYNGPQHYMIDNIYTTTQEKLQYRKNLDKLKSDLLKEHGVNLITIHFKDVISEEYIKKSLVF